MSNSKDTTVFYQILPRGLSSSDDGSDSEEKEEEIRFATCSANSTIRTNIFRLGTLKGLLGEKKLADLVMTVNKLEEERDNEKLQKAVHHVRIYANLHLILVFLYTVPVVLTEMMLKEKMMEEQEYAFAYWMLTAGLMWMNTLIMWIVSCLLLTRKWAGCFVGRVVTLWLLLIFDMFVVVGTIMLFALGVVDPSTEPRIQRNVDFPLLFSVFGTAFTLLFLIGIYHYSHLVLRNRAQGRRWEMAQRVLNLV